MKNKQNEEKQAEEVQSIFEDDLKRTKKALETSITDFNKTKSEGDKYKVARLLHDTMQYVRNAALAVCAVLFFALTSCSKAPLEAPNTLDEIHQELITQNFTLTTILTKQMPMAKGFDPAQWQYVYSDVKYELKISNVNNTYTRIVSVQDMLQGTVSFQLVPGLYSISYNPVHTPKFDSKLDVSINMTNKTIDGTPIVMQGELADALVILDIPALQDVYFNYPLKVFTKDIRGFWFAYTNTAFSGLELSGGIGNDAYDKMLSITPLALGKVYWVQSNIGATVQLNIPVMTVETVILP